MSTNDTTAERSTGSNIIEAGNGAKILGETSDTGDRPDDCECGEFHTDTELPCWPCHREGFETVAEHVGGDSR